MLRGTGTTSSVIHAAGSPGAGVSARPNVLVVLVNTKLPTPAAAASSSSVSVPVTLVSTKSCRVCEPTCGLCKVAGCRTAPAPEVHEVAMARLREEIGLEPVEYPTTRQLGASPQARAADLMAAFADPGIKAVLATIGGDDQITVLPFLDPEVVQANPKAFFGY